MPIRGNQPARVIGQQGDVVTNSSTNFEGRTRTRLFSLKIFFQAEPGEACELSAGQACAIFASLCYRHVSGKKVWEKVGRWTHARRMMGGGTLVNAVRMRAPVHTLADQCGQAGFRLFVGCEVLACLAALHARVRARAEVGGYCG